MVARSASTVTDLERQQIIDTDVTQLLFPGRYIYTHSVYGEVKKLIFPLSEERFWLVDVYPFVAFGSIYEVRPDGLYATGARPLLLEGPVPTPPAGFDATKLELVVPSRFRASEPIVVVHEDPEEGVVGKVELLFRMVNRDGNDFIVVRGQSSASGGPRAHPAHGIVTEEWWQQGIGVVRVLFIAPPAIAGEMELLRREVDEPNQSTPSQP